MEPLSQRRQQRRLPHQRPTPESPDVSRRTVLTGAGLVTLAFAGPQLLWATPAAAMPEPGDERSATDPPATQPLPVSANGWPMVDELARELRADLVLDSPAPGTGLRVPLAVGAPSALLLYVVRRYHYEIARLDLGPESVPQLTGYRPRPTGSLSAAASNHASGTALTIRSDWYPAGVVGGYDDRELTVLRDILAQCGGAVRWGGDTSEAPDESYFEIALAPGSYSGTC